MAALRSWSRKAAFSRCSWFNVICCSRVYSVLSACAFSSAMASSISLIRRARRKLSTSPRGARPARRRHRRSRRCASARSPPRPPAPSGTPSAVPAIRARTHAASAGLVGLLGRQARDQRRGEHAVVRRLARWSSWRARRSVSGMRGPPRRPGTSAASDADRAAARSTTRRTCSSRSGPGAAAARMLRQRGVGRVGALLALGEVERAADAERQHRLRPRPAPPRRPRGRAPGCRPGPRPAGSATMRTPQPAALGHLHAAQRRLLARGVGVEGQQHGVGQAAQLAHAAPRSARCPSPRPTRRSRRRAARSRRCSPRPRSRGASSRSRAGLVQPVEEPALLEDLGLGAVQVLRALLARHHPRAEAAHAAARVAQREHDAAAEAVDRPALPCDETPASYSSSGAVALGAAPSARRGPSRRARSRAGSARSTRPTRRARPGRCARASLSSARSR